MFQKICMAAIVLLPFCSTVAFAQANLPDPFPDPPSASNTYYKNQGQIIDESENTHPEIRYYTERTSPALYLADDKVSFVALWTADTITNPGSVDTSARIDMRFICKSAMKATDVAYCGDIQSYEQTGDHLNYYLEHCGSGIENVPGYSRIVYQDAFPSIDVHFYSNDWGSKIYFVVKPGGDPADIQLAFDGPDSISTLTTGALAVYLRSWSMQFPQAISYQIDPSNNTTIMPWLPTWIHSGGGLVNVSVGTYDPSQTLVIAVGGVDQKPTTIDNLDWSVYYGGSGTEANPKCFANGKDILYHAMSIRGPGFLSTNGTAYTIWGTSYFRDWYITRFDHDGVRLWATYYGGRGEDIPNAIEEQFPGEGTGWLWVAGMSKTAADAVYPGINLGSATAVFRQANGGGSNFATYYNGLLASFDKADGTLKYGTFIGDKWSDLIIHDMSIDNISNTLYLGGTLKNNSNFFTATTFNNNCSAQTTGSFPLCSGSGRFFQGSLYDNEDDAEGYIAEFDLSDRSLVWSTLFGGQGNDNIFSILKVHNENENALYIGGGTFSRPLGSGNYPSSLTSYNNRYFPLANPGGSAFFQSSTIGDGNFFVAKFDADHKLAWSTYLGKSDGGIDDIAMNSEGKLYFTGSRTNLNYAAANSSASNGSGLVPTYTNGTSYSQASPLTNSNTIIGSFNTNKSLGWSAFLPGSDYLLGDEMTSSEPFYYHPSIAIDNSDKIFFGNYIGICNAPTFHSPGNYYKQFNASQPGTNTAKTQDGYILAFKDNEAVNWGTFFGGSITPAQGITPLDGLCDLTISGGGYMYVTGITECTNSPYKECLTGVPGSYCDQSFNYGGTDCYISRFAINNLPDPVTGINETKNSNKNLLIYPNPTNGDIVVRFLNDKNKGAAGINILDIRGRVLRKEEFKMQQGINQFTLHTSGLAQGTYFIELTSETARYTAKFNKL